MEKHERRQFLEGARDLAPSSVNTAFGEDRNIPSEHQYALVEVLNEDEGRIYVRVLATGDGPGIEWAWAHGQGNHPSPSSLRIMDLTLAEEAIADGVGETFDFH
jgi:hypothetical protein